MAPRHPRGEQPGSGLEAEASTPTSVPRAASRDDSAFLEEVVRDILEQNERSRQGPASAPSPSGVVVSGRSSATASAGGASSASASSASSTSEAPSSAAVPTPRTPEHAPGITTPPARSAGVAAPGGTSAPAPATAAAGAVERPRTVRVERDSGFRTPEGVATARAYLPAKTVAPGRTEPVEIETVKVSDPRKLPTMRLPRERREHILREGGGRGPRVALPEDSAPTLRSAPATPPSLSPARSTLSLWIAGVVGVAVVSMLLVALAARFWPSVSARPAPSTAPSGPAPSSPAGPEATSSVAAPIEPPPAVSASARPFAAPTSDPSSDASAGSRTAPSPRSDRWY